MSHLTPYTIPPYITNSETFSIISVFESTEKQKILDTKIIKLVLLIFGIATCISLFERKKIPSPTLQRKLLIFVERDKIAFSIKEQLKSVFTNYDLQFVNFFDLNTHVVRKKNAVYLYTAIFNERIAKLDQWKKGFYEMISTWSNLNHCFPLMISSQGNYFGKEETLLQHIMRTCEIDDYVVAPYIENKTRGEYQLADSVETKMDIELTIEKIQRADRSS